MVRLVRGAGGASVEEEAWVGSRYGLRVEVLPDRSLCFCLEASTFLWDREPEMGWEFRLVLV